MKPEEALEELSYEDTAYGGKCTYEVRMQIPEKPKNVKSIFDFSGRYYTTKGDCPCCGAKGLFRAISYCYSCGQKLDWGEEDDK